MNFSLRPWTYEDLDSLVRYANNYNIAKYMTDQFPHPYTVEKGRAFISFATKGLPIHIFAIDIGSVACGGIGLHQQTDIQCKNAELGYWLAEPFWGKGIMTKAVKQMVDYGFSSFDLARIYARPFGSNTGSQRVLEKAGFTFEARFEKAFFKYGEFVDELYYAIRKSK